MMNRRNAWAVVCVVCEGLMWVIRLAFTPVLSLLMAMGIAQAMMGRPTSLRRHWALLASLLICGVGPAGAGTITSTLPMTTWVQQWLLFLQGPLAGAIGIAILTAVGLTWGLTHGEGNRNSGGSGITTFLIVGVALGIIFNADFIMRTMGFAAELPPAIIWSDGYPGELP